MEELGKDVQESSGCNTWWLSHPPKNKTEWDALWVRIFRWVAHLHGYQPAFCNFTWGEFVACAMQDQKKWNKSKIAEANCLQHLTWSICDLTSIPHIYTSGMSNTTEFFYRVGVTGIVSLRKKPRKMGKFEEMQPWWLTKCIPLTV